MSSSWGSYPSIFSLGHRAVADLLKYPIICEEKVDGSQFSFGFFNTHDPSCPSLNGASCQNLPGCFEGLKVRSKGAVLHPEAPEGMFKTAVETVKRLEGILHPGWTYRGEVLAKPKHNTLVYDRVPKGHIILFDINSGDQEYLSYVEKEREAERIGLEVVPCLFQGVVKTIAEFRTFLETTSILGGQKVEGVVVKPVGYNLFGLDKKVLLGKFVSEEFKEAHRANWNFDNPSNKDFIGRIIDQYTTNARFMKARQHLREAGLLEGSVRDIGKLIAEVPEDIKKEHEEDIKEALFKFAWPDIRRGVTRGLPQWYKDELLRDQFEGEFNGHQGSGEEGK